METKEFSLFSELRVAKFLATLLQHTWNAQGPGFAVSVATPGDIQCMGVKGGSLVKETRERGSAGGVVPPDGESGAVLEFAMRSARGQKAEVHDTQCLWCVSCV
ncbi:unnamed protein product [Urochloa humidicola]